MGSKVELKPSDFVHLHNHTHFSVLDGLQKIKEMVYAAKDMGMEAIAITDHGTLGGAIELYKVCKEAEIRPIIGMEAYVSNRKHTDKDPEIDRQRYHLIILAMNNEGLQNLYRLTSISYIDGFYFKPRIDRDLLKKHNEGLIILSGCIGGELGDALRNGRDKEAEETILWYKEVFGDRYYLELQNHNDWQPQDEVNSKLLELGKKHEIKCVITDDAHYLNKSDQDVHEVLLCVQTASNLDDPKRFSLKDTDLHLSDPKEIIESWGKDHGELILNTKEVASRCNIDLEFGNILIPTFSTQNGETEKTMLHRLTWNGVMARYGGRDWEVFDSNLSLEDEARKELPKELVERIDFELSTVDGMGFNGYFLIVQDFINWGKDNGIIFGPGRGSAAGSVVSYALRITELDPLKYDLLFERFLNPDRISMPDIDIDIQDTRRSEVIEYCVNKYGKERVSNIGTYGVMAAKAAVRDAARVLGMPYIDADRLAKLVPGPVQGRHVPLKKSIEDVEELRQAYNDNEVNKRVLDIAVRLDGTIRNVGVHAAGVIIAPGVLTDYVPLYVAPSGVIASQYTMGPIEDLGLLKMDFLGLSNLTTVNNAVRIVKKVYGVDIDINSIPLDDEKVFKMLQKGDTTGVFQLESDGMRKYLKRLKPDRFEDIIAMCALYRPGPLSAGLVDTFIRRKNGEEEVTYDHPSFESSYKDTYGVLVYQEQFMRFSREVCGFTGGQSDTLRKGVSKKKKEVLDKLGPDYIEGGIKTSNVPRELMEKSWNDLLGFSDYCFNKSHSACYALIAYQTAYLKAHYPDAFMAALMTTDFSDIDRLSLDIADCEKNGIKVLSPSVNFSFVEFGINKGNNEIRFGLGAIKNVGWGAAESIVEARESGDKYRDLNDFLDRVDPKTINKKVIESLIKSGALDDFGYSRLDLINNMDQIVSVGTRKRKTVNEDQVDIFGLAVAIESPKITINESKNEFEKMEKLGYERELLGLFLSEHPMDEYKDLLFKAYEEGHLTEIKYIEPKRYSGKRMSIAGIVTKYREISTKTGSKMAFVGVTDFSGAEIEIIVFPKIFAQKAEALKKPGSILIINGMINTKDKDGNEGEELKLMADEIIDISEYEDRDKIDFADIFERHQTKVSKNPRIKKVDNIDGSVDKLVDKDMDKSLDSMEKSEDKNVEKMSNISESSSEGKVMYIQLSKNNNDRSLLELKKMASKDGLDLILVVGSKPDHQAIRLPFKIKPEDIEYIKTIFEPENIVVK